MVEVPERFPIEAVRERFPALALGDRKSTRIYLDNPAGTQVPASVAEAVARCLVETNANLGGYFASSRAADEIVAGAHEAMADFLGTRDAGEVLIGASMTTLTFHLSRSLARRFDPGDELIVTRMDHEGNVAPWLRIAEDNGLRVRWAELDPETWTIRPDELSRLLGERTRLVALNYASNLTGAVNGVRELTRRAHEAGALVYVDAVQYAPHGPLDVAGLDCDFLACSAYKFFGPHLGVVWGRRELLAELEAYKCRCVSETLPDKFETGTPAIELQAGLGAAVDYCAALGSFGSDGSSGSSSSLNQGRALGSADGSERRRRLLAAFGAVRAYETSLGRALVEGLSSLPGVRLVGPGSEPDATERVPTVSFRHRTVPPKAIAAALAAEGIFVWSGHNYALESVRQLGIPEDEGVVRIGAVHYNTLSEVERAVDAVERAIDRA